MAVVPALIGCTAGGAHSHARTASDAATQDAELTALRVQLDDQEQEIRTLRGQLALARAELQELEGKSHRGPAGTEPVSGGDSLPWKEGRDGVIVDERLAVTAEVPDLPDFGEPTATPTAERPTVSIEGYRRGLDLVRQQRFKEALVELDAFASMHPGHPYADNALFWCGEIHYLRREYAPALDYFERLETLHPWGNKAPDALYRMGQIHLRRGDRARAQAYFDKVREQFPETAAARLALREDAS